MARHFTITETGTLVALAAGLLTLVGGVTGGVWALDVRYVSHQRFAQHAEDVSQKFKAVQIEVLEQRLAALRRTIFELEEAGRRRRLSPEEQSFLAGLRNDEVNLQRRLRGLDPSVTP